VAEQHRLFEEPVALTELNADPGTDHGEVFTRRWVVEMILDLVGYVADGDLTRRTIVEPSCGTGAFLVPIVERLLAAAGRSRVEIGDLTEAIQAFDLLESNASLARKNVVATLLAADVSEDDAWCLAERWIRTGDFLLHAHEGGTADHVVGNPPYVRLENVPAATSDEYRRRWTTMRGRSDIYVGFIECGLQLLRSGGTLGFICADRWMRNQYGAGLRELVTRSYAVDTIVSMHDVDAFEDDVSAYPAVVVLRNGTACRTAVIDAEASFGPTDATAATTWVAGRSRRRSTRTFSGSKLDTWFEGRDLWPTGSPDDLSLLADLESRFPPLQDPATGTRVGIGVATGCDEVFITEDPDVVESDRLLPLLKASDTRQGSAEWSGSYLVNPWDEAGLVDLDEHPRLDGYLHAHAARLRGRHVAETKPNQWYRTIDRVDPTLTSRPKLLLPDIKASAHPVLDSGVVYPHHNLYYVVSDEWDLGVLGGLLLSDIANLFVGAYCVKMRGGAYRFQAQYLRRIRVPEVSTMDTGTARRLSASFADRDRAAATLAAREAYGLAG
jgi:hypothetical protein